MNQRSSREKPGCRGHVPKRRGVAKSSDRNVQAAQVENFLKGALSGGAMPAGELEVKARAAGLLGERTRIADAKRFKAAKKRLGIMSRRAGFGRGGEWFWQLPAVPSVPTTEVRSGPAPTVPVLDAYEGGPPPRDIHVSTEAQRADAEIVSDDAASKPIPLEWVRGVALARRRPPPSSIPAHRWRIFIQDCLRFLASPWAERAAELGWETSDVFASRFPNPHEHLGSSGLA
jgi:hypothetical protein